MLNYTRTISHRSQCFNKWFSVPFHVLLQRQNKHGDLFDFLPSDIFYKNSNFRK